MISSFCRFAERPAKRGSGVLRSARKSRKMRVEIEIRRFADLRPLPAKRQNRPSACPGSGRDSPFCRFYRVYKYTLCKKPAKRESDPSRCIRRPQNGKSAKRQIREMKASAATGDENLGERNPKIPRRGRRVTLCHSGARKVNGQKRGKIKPLGGRRRPASGGWDDMSRRGHGSSLNPSQRQGAGRSPPTNLTFFLRAKIFQEAKPCENGRKSTPDDTS